LTPVTFSVGPRGLVTLARGAANLLAKMDMAPTFVRVGMIDAAGRASPGSVAAAKTVTDPSKGLIVQAFGWGMVTTTYTAVGDVFHIDVQISNTTTDLTITQLWFYVLALALPSIPANMATAHTMGFNIDAPTTSFFDLGAAGAVSLVNEDVVKPVAVGWWPMSSRSKTQWFVSLQTDPGSLHGWPPTPRPIAPGQTDRFSVSLRFGDAGSTEAQLSADIYALYGKTFPPPPAFSNKPIAMLNMTSKHRPVLAKNPRGWFSAAPWVDVTTPLGIAAFHGYLLGYATGAIAEMRRVGAQGGILWDIEGQEFDWAYGGDPGQAEVAAPELIGVIDEFVAMFVSAGFRIGFTLRPQTLDLTNHAFQPDGPDPGGTLAAKMDYAIKRWGATLFYVDSSVVSNVPTAAAIFETLAKAHPGVLIFPEWESTRHYAYTVPYNNSLATIYGPPAEALAVYPDAICLIALNDVSAAAHPAELQAAAAAGNILCWPGWYPNPAGDLVRKIYAGLA
jgi:hypothetical protein